MSTWALHDGLVQLAGGADAEVAAVAKRVADAYEYPVDSLVLTSAGEILGHVGAMDAMMDESAYVRLLDAAGAARDQ